ncbi:hypothetical protein H8788_03345 [Parabacteroides faecis]|uniref:hypothetical protein n=1 Tax=Parabacteroides TaxID=375288 RepID=UPI001655E72E|nr:MULTISPECIES: hypothetical protein [Parabacteroides]MBC8616761.1 hypothetical protein [Parabacteroides faecis]
MKNKIQAFPFGNRLKYLTLLLKNLLAAGIVLLFLVKVVETRQGYGWVYKGLLKANMKTIKAHPNLTTDQRFEIKLGFSYSYLEFIRKNTPDNAVILYPGRESFFPENKKTPFNGDVCNKVWVTRFLFPRKIILQEELSTSPYKDEISHVAIVNGFGFDKVNYKVNQSFEYGILPINPSKK